MTHCLGLSAVKDELFPNKTNNIGSTDLLSLKDVINKKRERNKKEEKSEHAENWKLFSEELSTLRSQTEEIKQMLRKILNQQNIPEP
jgi:Mg2+ and Co2+ transporter CorA